jgi:hypothetical protein
MNSPSATATKGEPQDFVYCGRREATDGSTLEVIYTLTPDGELEGRRAYSVVKGMRPRIIGGIYRGTNFDEKNAYGYTAAEWVGPWRGDSVKVAQWKADEYAFDQKRASARAASKYKDELDEQLMPLRRTYHALQKRGDWHSAEAYRNMVIALLCKPLTKKEQADE